MTSHTNDSEARHALTTGLRDLADYLDLHSDVPVSGWQQITYHVRAATDADGIAALAVIAQGIGVQVTDVAGRSVAADTSHFYAARRFGPIKYAASYIRRQEMADHDALMSYSGTIRADRAAVTA